MKTKDESGFVVPQAVVDSIRDQLTGRKSLYETLRLSGLPDTHPRRRLTLRQRFRLLRANLRWRLHDWLFPTCPAGDDE